MVEKREGKEKKGKINEMGRDVKERKARKGIEYCFTCPVFTKFYTESKKMGHFYFYCNFVKCWPILLIFLHLNQKPFADKIRVIFSTAL